MARVRNVAPNPKPPEAAAGAPPTGVVRVKRPSARGPSAAPRECGELVGAVLGASSTRPAPAVAGRVAGVGICACASGRWERGEAG